MDPVAHTLAGASLAQTGLKKLTPLATLTLIIGANLPDIDVVFHILGNDASLYHRRGHTHGIVAMMVLPMLLTGSILAFDRFLWRRYAPHREPISVKAVLLLSYIGVLSHPFLDWLNTYGVRLLMPFSSRWFYGDTLFIVDPWVWLLMASSVVLACTRHWVGKVALGCLAAALSLVIMTTDLASLATKVLWCFGVGLIVALRWKRLSDLGTQRAAMLCMVGFLLYLAALGFGSRRAQGVLFSELTTPDESYVIDMMVGPLPANPFKRHVVVATVTHHYGFVVSLFGINQVHELYPPVPRRDDHPAALAALRDEGIRGFANWVRFPAFEIESKEDSYLVTIRDLRYVGPDAPVDGGIGVAQVAVRFEDL